MMNSSGLECEFVVLL